MSAPHRWSLLVPVMGVLVAIALLPAVTTSLVPDPVREPLSYLAVWVPLLVAVLLSVRLARRRRAETWWSTLHLPLDVTGTLVGLFVGLAARSVAVGADIVTTGRIGTGLPFFEGGPLDASTLLWVIVASAVIAPMVEETFFRGTFLPAVTERIASGRAGEWLAIVIVASVFAAVHAVAGSTPPAALVTFVAGVGFGFAFRSNGTGSAIVAHVAFNASGLVLAAASDGPSSIYPTLTMG